MSTLFGLRGLNSYNERGRECELKQSGKKEYCHLGCYHLFYAYRRKLIIRLVLSVVS